jgi:hypothetical protein
MMALVTVSSAIILGLMVAGTSLVPLRALAQAIKHGRQNRRRYLIPIESIGEVP